MRKIFTACAGLLLALACAACAGPPPTDNDPYFIIGVTPGDAVINVQPGDFINGITFKPYWPTKFDTGFYYEGGTPDGFIVGRMHADAPIGIAYITPNGAARAYAPCGGAKTMVMSAPAGKVFYFGSAHYSASAQGGLTASFTDDFAGAKAYLQKHYPELAGRLEHGQPRFYPTDQGCALF